MDTVNNIFDILSGFLLVHSVYRVETVRIAEKIGILTFKGIFFKGLRTLIQFQSKKQVNRQTD